MVVEVLCEKVAVGTFHTKGGPFESLEHVMGHALFQNPSLMHEGDPRAARSLVHIGSGDENSHAFANERGNQVPEFPTTYRINAVGRLVENQHLWLMQQGAGQREFFVHASRQGIGSSVVESLQSGQLEQFFSTFRILGLAQTEHRREKREVFTHGQVPVQAILLGHITDGSPHFGGFGGGGMAEQTRLASVRVQKSHKNAD